MKNFFKKITKLNSYVLYIVTGLGIGIFYDTIRLQIFFLSIPIPQFIDQFLFCIKILFFFVAVYYEVRLTALILKNSGQELRYDKILKGSLISLIIIFTFLSVLLSYPLPSPGMGIYTFKIAFSFYIVITVFILSLFTYMFNKTRKIYKIIKDNNVKSRFTLAIAVFVPLTLERILSDRPFVLFPYGYMDIVFDLTVLLVIVSIGVTMLIIFPDIIESINAYFSVISLYLIKDNGSLLYSHQFKVKEKEDTYSASNLLLAGFLFTVRRGIESAMGLHSELRTLDYGENILLIGYGEYLFGVIVCSDYSPLIEEKLDKFLKRIESRYKEQLKDWKGKISFLKEDEMREEISKSFR